MTYERDDYMRRQEADHDLLRMRQTQQAGHDRNHLGTVYQPSEWAKQAAKAVGERAAQMTADESQELADLRAAMRQIDDYVGFAYLGDVSLSLTAIRKIARAFKS